ncbi:MAG: MoxR family ATPase [Caldilineae bacterium]|nr:MAG: MoxR family ATPase [Caldilineae bacterium]
MTIQETARKLQENIAAVLVGKEPVVELALVALLCEGHLLLEDVPGIGKTTLARALARSLGCSFARIQFTPDLLPSDISGVSVFNQQTQQFEYRPGPVLNQIVLADEINRATPRTQSALLEAMQERTVSVDGVTHPLPRPFMVLATQNPIELEGTFPLPEAQVDRFMMRLSLGYPTEAEENEILRRHRQADPIESLAAVTEPETLLAVQRQVRDIRVEESVQQYIVQVVQATRNHPAVELGASPRGSLALYRGAQALAAIRGRDFVLPDDVKHLAPHVLTHRLIISPQTRLRGRTPEMVLAEVMESVPVPVETLF